MNPYLVFIGSYVLMGLLMLWIDLCQELRERHGRVSETETVIDDTYETGKEILTELQMARGLIRQGQVSAGAERLDYVIDRLRRTQEDLEAA